jgi:hypothetical protein
MVEVVDLAKVTALALLSVRRATAFLAMGFRTINLPLPLELSLEEHSMLRFFPSPLPPELSEEVVNQFRIWIIGAALRELDAGYSLYLDSVYQVLTIFKDRKISVDLQKRKAIKQFTAETNVAKKFLQIENDFGIKAKSRVHIERVSMARNVLQHAGGRVRSRECVHAGHFELTWLGFDTRFVGESTGVIERVISDALREPYMAQDPKGMRVELVFVQRSRAFSEGQVIELSPHDLHEICFMYQNQTVEIHEEAAKYATAHGIQTTGKVQLNLNTATEYVQNDEMREITQETL